LILITYFPVNRNVFEIMCENMVKPDDNIILRMHITCRITKARIHTHTLRIYNTYCSSTASMVIRTRLRDTHSAPPILLSKPSLAVINPFVCGLPEVPDSQTVDFRISTVTECLTAEPEFPKIRSDSE